MVYTEYVKKKYGKPIVVFDGYSGTSTKDMTHQRRSKWQIEVAVTFTEEMQLTIKKAHFLANTVNKQQFIKMLGVQLLKGCIVYYASGDADRLIVKKVVDSTTKKDTVFVGDDTDLLVLLCYHASQNSHNIFFVRNQIKSTKNPKVWNIKLVKEHLGPEICTHILFVSACTPGV